MSVDEIRVLAKVQSELQEEREKKELNELYLTAFLTASFVGRMLNGRQLPSIYETFPNVFTEPEQDWQAYEAKFMSFAEQHNKQRGGNQ